MESVIIGVIVGVVIKKEDKVLVVKEAKKKCYGKYNFPAGKLDGNESIFEAAIREAKEETGYYVKLNKLLSIQHHMKNAELPERIGVFFTASITGGEINFDKNEILDVEWIEIDKLLNMTDKEVRNVNLMHSILKKLKADITYPLELIEEFLNKEEE